MVIMYLKEIVASGFKSFADKLSIKLDDKTTCIVGPNGSGKSNIVDAVRWVLGEQSVKSLRGEGAMSEVIFSGSKSRNPLNVASVELIFDNSDHYLNIPYTEISIKRKVYRNGENEYILNHEKCRLKDITDLLMDSGIGKESFNIISQGEVDRILSTSSGERRIIFEEAAGILKYKKRKEEALRKLDRTHNNLDRVNDIINELEIQVEPLKEQSKKARKYLETKEKLEKLDIALITNDILFYSNEVNKNKEKKESLEQEIVLLSNRSSLNNTEDMKNQQRLELLEQELNQINKDLVILAEEVEKLNGERLLLRERTSKNDTNEVLEKLRKELDNKGNISKKIELLQEEVKLLENKRKDKISTLDKNKTELEKINKEQNMEQLEYSKMDRDLITLNHKIDSIKTEIEAGGNVPSSVRKVLNEHSLGGIHNTIGNILEIDNEYIKALEIAISSSKNFIITEDENAAKSAIRYLKDNHLGRATFFPLTVIKKRYVDKETLSILRNDSDFIAVLSDLVKYNKKYESIIENQLGTVIVSKNIDSATRLSKKIRARYKVVTLDGDVVHIGGSMSGGSSYSSKSMISLKQNLLEYQNELENKQERLENVKEKVRELSSRKDEINEIYATNSRDKMLLDQELSSKIDELSKREKELDEINSKITSYESVENNSIDQKEQELMNAYQQKSTEKDKMSLRKESIVVEIDNLKQIIEEATAKEKSENSKLRNLEKEVNDLEVKITRADVKLDSMLNTLNEDYSMTYEKAKSMYVLEIDEDEARNKVSIYKSEIRKLGMVNLAAIEEYERVNTRYEFLNNQKEDLLKAEETLLDIMNEMDDVMIEEFKKTFEKIRQEFKVVFRELFHGGNADLILTNPDDILTTGVDIVASPPGKKLTTITLLSGGEKTFTAISLLFAILNIKTVPFCLFDEVEAALDDANVNAFGNYLKNYKNKTQFLIITHKKKTMEYADTLYGITMQESGVSKLVSVKLNQKVETI
jgi:protein P115